MPTCRYGNLPENDIWKTTKENDSKIGNDKLADWPAHRFMTTLPH